MDLSFRIAFLGIYLLLFFSTADSQYVGGKLTIEFIKYDNPEGRSWNGYYCDGATTHTSPCDPVFDIKVTASDGLAGPNLVFSTDEYRDQNNIAFSNSLGAGKPNPFSTEFKYWPDAGYNIQVTIRDIDPWPFNWELQDKMKTSMKHTPGQNGFLEVPMKGERKYKPSLLTIAYKVECNQFYHGFKCTTYCKAEDGANGHYTCKNTDGSKICNTNYYDVSKNCMVYCKGSDDESGHYTCDENTGHILCIPGWTDPDCRTDIDECLSSPCQNQGECLNLINKYECKCKKGTFGTNCEINKDECAKQPCKNGGICVDGIGEYFCECPKGFNGTDCEIQVNECDNNPCHNGGTCKDIIGSFECLCPTGYAGPTCAIVVNTCLSSTCVNGATCTMVNGTNKCICPLGFKGDNCEIEIDYCETAPCKNNGTCTSVYGDFECNCTSEFIGKTCERQFDKCVNMKCQNGATCGRIVGLGYVCHCAPGFEGNLCESKKNYCKDDPCKYGGNCTNHIDKFTCKCLEGFEGLMCENDVRPTTPSPTTAVALPTTAGVFRLTGSDPMGYLPYILTAFGVFVVTVVIVLLIVTKYRLNQKRRAKLLRHISMENNAYGVDTDGLVVENDIYGDGNIQNNKRDSSKMVENDIYGDGVNVGYSKSNNSVDFHKGELRISGLSSTESKS